MYSFLGYPDGQMPEGGLVALNGSLYGTTAGGGAHAEGTFFQINSSGQESILHSFGAGKDDGNGPTASLIAVNGVLYGTTEDGGGSRNGRGAVFSITTSGVEKLIHGFTKGDGAYPVAALTNVGNVL